MKSQPKLHSLWTSFLCQRSIFFFVSLLFMGFLSLLLLLRPESNSVRQMVKYCRRPCQKWRSFWHRQQRPLTEDKETKDTTNAPRDSWLQQQTHTHTHTAVSGVETFVSHAALKSPSSITYFSSYSSEVLRWDVTLTFTLRWDLYRRFVSAVTFGQDRWCARCIHWWVTHYVLHTFLGTFRGRCPAGETAVIACYNVARVFFAVSID